MEPRAAPGSNELHCAGQRSVIFVLALPPTIIAGVFAAAVMFWFALDGVKSLLFARLEIA